MNEIFDENGKQVKYYYITNITICYVPDLCEEFDI